MMPDNKIFARVAAGKAIHEIHQIKFLTEDDSIKNECQQMLNFLFEHFPDAAPKPEPISQVRQ